MNDTIPCVSLGLPVYNGQNFIRIVLDSILSQSFKDFELIISDNASTDKTEAICQEYKTKDCRIRYYRNLENIGAAKNYNRVFELSRGKYFAWINHDDWYAREFLEKCVENLECTSLAIIAYPKSFLIDEQGKPIGELFCNHKIDSESSYERFKRFHECIWKASISGGYPAREGIWIPVYGLMRREVLSKTKLIGSHISSDTTLLEELALLGKFCLVPIPLFYKRDHSKRSMQSEKSYVKRILWFDPEKKGKLLFPQWKLLLEQFNVINRHKLNWYEKLLCYSEIFRRFRLQWRVLFLEIFINLKHILLAGKIANKKNKSPDFWY